MATVGMDIGHSESTWEEIGGKGVKTSLHPSGRMEEHWFNAEISLIAKEILERHGVKVVMAQKPYDNNEVSLAARIKFYDNHNCDLIVSNHANAGVKTANGFSVFYWHNSSSAKKLAEILLKHSKSLPIKQFGKGIIASVPNTWTDFHMCREPKAVSPLLEWGFMTNDDDLKLLLDPAFRKQCGEVQAKAILEYLNIPHKSEVKPVEQTIKKEEDEMLEKAVLVGALPDIDDAELVCKRLQAPLFFRGGIPNKKVAKELYVVGGLVTGLEKYADKIIPLTGADRFAVTKAVEDFLKK